MSGWGGLARGTCVAGLLCASTLGAAPTEEAAPRTAGEAYYLYSLAQQDRFRRNYGDALAHLRTAVAVDPDSAAVRLELARLYWMLGGRQNNFEEQALRQGREAARLAPDRLETERFLATVLTALATRQGADQELLGEAIGQQEKVLGLAAEDDRSGERLVLGRLYQIAGRPADAAAVLEPLIAEEGVTAEAQFLLYRAYFDLGNLEKASLTLRRALDLAPTSIPMLEAWSELQERRGDLAGALAAAREVVTLAPDSVEAQRRLARVLRRSGNPTEALAVYEGAEQMLRRQSSDEGGPVRAADLKLERAETLLEAGRGAEALALVSDAARAHPGDPRYRLALGQLQYRNGEQEQGLQTLESVLKDRAGDLDLEAAVSDALLALGARHERAGEFTSAERLLQRAVDVNPENDTALNYLGYLWADRGTNIEQGLVYIERAIRIGGENGAYLDSLGWANFRLRRYDAAETLLRRAASLSPDEAEIQMHLGDLYEATARLPLAIIAWERALELGIPDAAALRGRIDAAQRALETPR
jgi:tetratricopeptide (TPR) repeat protein